MSWRERSASTFPPGPGSGVFRKFAGRSGAPPDLLDFANDARWLSTPATCAVALTPNSVAPHRTVVVGNDGVMDCPEQALLSWIGNVEEVCLQDVPFGVERHLQCVRAIVVPLWTPSWRAGVVAVPFFPGRWNALARQLERLGNDFALRLEIADRRATLAQLRRRQVSVPPPLRRSGHGVVKLGRALPPPTHSVRPFQIEQKLKPTG